MRSWSLDEFGRSRDEIINKIAHAPSRHVSALPYTTCFYRIFFCLVAVCVCVLPLCPVLVWLDRGDGQHAHGAEAILRAAPDPREGVCPLRPWRGVPARVVAAVQTKRLIRRRS